MQVDYKYRIQVGSFKEGSKVRVSKNTGTNKFAAGLIGKIIWISNVYDREYAKVVVKLNPKEFPKNWKPKLNYKEKTRTFELRDLEDLGTIEEISKSDIPIWFRKRHLGEGKQKEFNEKDTEEWDEEYTLSPIKNKGVKWNEE